MFRGKGEVPSNTLDSQITQFGNYENIRVERESVTFCPCNLNEAKIIEE